MDSSGRGGAGKPSAAAPGTPGAAKPRARRAQGGRVVESRYLQYEKNFVIHTELLRPFEAAAGRFRDGYTALATALDGTRHELPVRSVHLEGGGRRLLDALQPELNTAYRLLGELGVGSAEPTQALALLSELRGLAVEKDVELRSFAQVLELSAEASKEAALLNQRAWEEAQGPAAPSRWYFREDSARGERPLSQDEPGPP